MAIERHGHTYRLDWQDSSIREWTCTVVWSDPADPQAGIVLDSSAFYPGGGGQPPDHGVLLWQGVQTRIVGTRKGVLCGTVFRDFGAMVTGGSMEPGEARMDFNLPDIPPGFKQSLEDAVNAEIMADRKIDIRWLPRAEALAIPDIVRTKDRLPPETAEMRLVDIVGLDVQADGGTHVASTRQVGRLRIWKVENKGRQNRRVRIRLADLAVTR